MIIPSGNVLGRKTSELQKFMIVKRFKQKKIHWATLEKEAAPINKALNHFDDFYKSIFRLKWKSIRLGLLSPHKYVALLNNFGDIEKTETDLTNLGAVNLKNFFDLKKEDMMEKSKEISREKSLDKIFQLEKEMDIRTKMKTKEEFGQIYPQEDDVDKLINHNNEEEKTALSLAVPLVKTLSNPQIDEQRIIDPDNVIDASTLYEYVPATKLKGMEDYTVESQHYGYYKADNSIPICIEDQTDLFYPEHLKVYSFERGNVSSFPQPRRGTLNVLNYYLFDGASILPVIALDIKPGDYVLDMCAAPGGKSLAIIQTLYPKLVVCNDSSISRYKKMYHMFETYLDDFDKWKSKLMFHQLDGCLVDEMNFYDKILVDVPCTTDRFSLFENDNNIFAPKRVKERIKLPETQANLLTNALKLVRNNGTVVYSTCSLSPIQNDGVVNMALKTCWQETKREFKIINMTKALQCTTNFYNYATNIGMKYGHLVTPFLPSNFGPLYFCKIVRTK